MTQTECYKRLGWPLEGVLLDSILPLYPEQEDGSTCWVAHECHTCGMRGLSRTETPGGIPLDYHVFECVNGCGFLQLLS